jgi:hypothetical protein
MMSTPRAIRVPRRIWAQATQALGKLWAEVISLPGRSPGPPRHEIDDYPRYPWL